MKLGIKKWIKSIFNSKKSVKMVLRKFAKTPKHIDKNDLNFSVAKCDFSVVFGFISITMLDLIK